MQTWTVRDVMTRPVVSVDRGASYRNLVDLLTEKRISALPVIDEAGHVLGVVSETDLLEGLSPRRPLTDRGRSDGGRPAARRRGWRPAGPRGMTP